MGLLHSEKTLGKNYSGERERGGKNSFVVIYDMTLRFTAFL